MSSAAVQAVDIRHWTFGCAMTLGASTMVAAAAATSAPLAFTMNLRRSVVTLPSSLGLRGTTGLLQTGARDVDKRSVC
jgi:hypothetical protein